MMSDYAVLLEEIADREAEARAVMQRAGERTISVVGCDASGGALAWTGKMVAHVSIASWGMCCYWQSSLMKMIHVSSLPLYLFLLFLSFRRCKFCEKGLGRKARRRRMM